MGIGPALFPVGMPLVLRLTKSNHRDRAPEERIAVSAGIVKNNPDLMRLIVIFIDDHERPSTIWPLQGIGSHQKMSLGVSDIARGSVEPVFSVFRLCPLLRYQLRSKKLGRGLLNLVVVVNHEHVVGPPTVGTGGMWW